MKRSYILGVIVLLVAASIYILTATKQPFDQKSDWRLKKGLDLAGGVAITLQAQTDKMPAGQKWDPSKDLQTIVGIIRNRIDGLGVSEPLIQPKGSDQIIVELPGIANKEEAIKLLQGTAQLEFWHLPVKDARHPGAKYDMRVGQDKSGSDEYSFIDTASSKEVKLPDVLKDSDLIVTGHDLLPRSSAEPYENGMRTVVALEFTQQGTDKFAEFTKRNRDEVLAIVLDGRVLSAPKIDEPILDGRAIIRGNFTPETAQKLARYLNGGALPVPLTIISKQVVEATLGQVSVNKSVTAGAVGLGLVVFFMIVYYLLPGILADVALGIYALLTLAAFKLMNVTLTLPGITAFILSIGMAVDANILIFERLKEELRNGKTLRAAIDAGFGRAFTSIFDSNMCTAITSLILMYFGTGPIKGFAVVLLLGVALSMFTAITVTRTFLYTIVNTGLGQKAEWFGLKRQWVTGKTDHQVDIVGKMNVWFGLSLAVIIPGLIFWLGFGGLHKGIDFTGGSILQVTYDKQVSPAAIDSTLTEIGFPNSAIQRARNEGPGSAGQYTYVVRTKALTSDKSAEVKDALQKQGGTVTSEEMVGGTISKELTRNAFMAVVLASLAIVIYLTARFAIGGLAFGFRFGICAVVALIHDVFVIMGTFAILGYFLHWEIDSLFVTALLTIIGFSVHDTIVIFDRIRENLRHRARGESFDGLVNRSILQSFARSINTSFTVVLTLAALWAFGAGGNIRQFVIALLIGIVSGTYSSIFNASQLLVLWQRIADRGKAPAADASKSNGQKARELKPLVDIPSGTMATAAAGEATAETDESKAAASKAKTTSAGGVKKRKRRF